MKAGERMSKRGHPERAFGFVVGRLGKRCEDWPIGSEAVREQLALWAAYLPELPRKQLKPS